MAYESELMVMSRLPNEISRTPVRTNTPTEAVAPSADSISVIGFVDQLRDPAGRRVSLSPRLGLETEPIADRMKVRLGTYLEPSRYENGFSRQHFTFGAEVKLFRFGGFWLVPELDICAIGAADLAPRYFSLGGSFCVWH